MRISNNQMNRYMQNSLQRNQMVINQSQIQISSGKKVTLPSDDPAQAGRLLNIEEKVSELEQYGRNANVVESQLSLEETVVSSAIDTLLRVRDLALEANSGVVDDAKRATLKSEITLRLDELKDLANTKNSNGEYLFSGTNSFSFPFHLGAATEYAGNDTIRRMPVGLGRTIAIGDTGADAFLRVRMGNGTFSTDAAAANTGTGIISTGTLNDSTGYAKESYNLVFTSATTFDVIDADTGTTVSTGNAFESKNSIVLPGIEVSISGQPQAGDTFSIRPSANRDVFTIVNDFIGALENSPVSNSDKALQQQSINNTLRNIDAAFDNLNNIRSRIGARLSSIETSREEMEAVKHQLTTTRSNIEDADIAEAVMDLEKNATAMEIMQKSFTRIESLSLFNYL